MKKTDITKIGVLGFLPIIIGGFIYLISRPKTILLFDWIRTVRMESESDAIRKLVSDYQISDWIRFNLPDLLWVFGFTSVMLIIWIGVQSKIKIFYIILPLFIGVVSELVQYFNPNFGTFDVSDISFYTLGSLTSILILQNINQSKYEEQITTSI